ncbi:SDR family NAD(P)-dependent oxidoreductase [Vibrio splendidus]|uniref:SDR family NAD(P)-dependent oxidoreductase n=1 Tax=Vibrio splendidus TaxID=29497 RepID=A0ABV4LSC3_VIBSP|nr:SDR family NAD(P)-dependent oxidoreductase [Vibrio splendidus]
MSKKILIIGATSGMAEHCSRIWSAEANHEFVLVGRSESRLEKIASDLHVRNTSSKISVEVIDFLDISMINDLIDRVYAESPIDIALIAHGSLPDQGTCQQDITKVNDVLNLNGMSPVLFSEKIAQKMEQEGNGTIAIIGSVAGERGRKSNYVYGAAKGLVTRYAEGLQHRFAGTDVKVVLIKPGPTDTPMTSHLKDQGAKLASVDGVAKTIVKAIKEGTPTVYAPTKWALIMAIIRSLPKFIFNKIDI